MHRMHVFTLLYRDGLHIYDVFSQIQELKSLLAFLQIIFYMHFYNNRYRIYQFTQQRHRSILYHSFAYIYDHFQPLKL